MLVSIAKVLACVVLFAQVSGQAIRITDDTKDPLITEIETHVKITEEQRRAMGRAVAVAHEAANRYVRENANKVDENREVLDRKRQGDRAKARAELDTFDTELGRLLFDKLRQDLERFLTVGQMDQLRSGRFARCFRAQLEPTSLRDDDVKRVIIKYNELIKGGKEVQWQELRPFVAGLLTSVEKTRVVRRNATWYAESAFPAGTLSADQQTALSKTVDKLAVESRFDSEWPAFEKLKAEIRERTNATMTPEQKALVEERVKHGGRAFFGYENPSGRP